MKVSLSVVLLTTALLTLLVLINQPLKAQEVNQTAPATATQSEPQPFKIDTSADPLGPSGDVQATVGRNPVIVLSETEFNYGDAQPSTTISHEFIVKNEGQGDLLIDNVVPGCGCSVASYTTFIPPQGYGKVTLSIDLYAEWAGHNVNKSATIISNDPVNPNTRITIRARVLEKKEG